VGCGFGGGGGGGGGGVGGGNVAYARDGGTRHVLAPSVVDQVTASRRKVVRYIETHMAEKRHSCLGRSVKTEETMGTSEGITLEWQD